ncbi:MAG: hypothetical protein V2A73_05970 [Pseudomonadota bacterium]
MRSLGLHGIWGVVALCLLCVVVGWWVRAAGARLKEAEASAAPAQAGVAVAAAANEGYCTGALRQILRRVLTSCGLVSAGRSRGCQPVEAKTVAAMSGGDFNALFKPLADRAAIVEFEKESALLDDQARELASKTFADQRGASYFFVVSRASPEGTVEYNRKLSEARANALLEFLRAEFKDPDLDQEVGLLWLGEEFAQLGEEFCQWKRSRPDATCTVDQLNRSAFVAWIDCRL